MEDAPENSDHIAAVVEWLVSLSQRDAATVEAASRALGLTDNQVREALVQIAQEGLFTEAHHLGCSTQNLSRESVRLVGDFAEVFPSP